MSNSSERKPRIAVTHDDSYRVDAYCRAIQAAGGEAVLVTPEHPLDLADVDGLLLTGGVDVNPALYGQAPHPETEQPIDARDELETALLRQALAEDKPILAVCRGMQLFNVAHGGTLHQHLGDPRHEERQDDKSIPAHEVTVQNETRLAGLIGPEARVNSRHHQSVDEVGAGLTVSARASDGVVEAVERPDRRFAVAVQWHPEDQAAEDPAQARLFEGLIEAARDVGR